MRSALLAKVRYVGFGVLLAISTVARGSTLLDQSNITSPDAGGFFAHSSQSPVQTFTAGVSGQLVGVDVFVRLFLNEGGSSPLQLEVWSLANATTLNQKLDSASLPKSDFMSNATFHHYSLGGSVLVTPGEVLAIVLRSNGVYPSQVYSWPISPGTSYPDGNGYTIVNGGSGKDLNPLHPSGGDPSFVDFGFKTFVNVPEPSSFILGALGLMGFAAWGWRRRRA